MESVQKKYAPNSICFGCGPANTKGLQIESFPISEKELKAEFTPQAHHEAFPGMINGGIIGTLLDCHSNWTSCWFLMHENKLDQPPCTVTAYFNVKLHKPTPSGQKLTLMATVSEFKSDRAKITATLECEGTVTASCEGLFVAVQPGHPAYNRWS